MFALAASAYAQKRPFDVETLLRVQRIGDPAISPDGKTVAFTVQSIDLDKNARPKQIYAVPVDGGAPRQLTRDGTMNERPAGRPIRSRSISSPIAAAPRKSGP